ncbi:MAG: hypothetical protein EA417_17955 [Gammaproteobacteria bacterium]|nr:hypothetical protein [Gammaproteobacteria bacterium]TVS11620.1 MAG: hypothetical protein EA417_17955 [Gammaproteobacteria bacterium]
MVATCLALPTLEAAAGEAEAAPLSDRELARGRILFLQCRACHAVPGDEGERTGPALHGIFGQEAAAAAGFRGYSEALRTSGIVWDTELMDRWLRDPARLVPGNTMAYAGIADDQSRDLLIRYLEVITEAE